jgi:hypothetical protein
LAIQSVLGGLEFGSSGRRTALQDTALSSNSSGTKKTKTCAQDLIAFGFHVNLQQKFHLIEKALGSYIKD